MTTDEITEIRERNQRRKQLKRTASVAPWEYDSFGLIHQSQRVDPQKRIGILLRPMTWYETLRQKYGNVLDQGFSQPKFIQAYYDAEYIIHQRNGSAEEDIDALLAEIARLRQRA